MGSTLDHAFLCTPTGSVVDLNPSDYINSVGISTDGTHQVGFAFQSTSANKTAFLWSGTATSGVSLGPGIADGVGGGQEVGVSTVAGSTVSHAFLWSGTAASAVDLNPSGITGINESQALATDGKQQVGIGFDSLNSNTIQALLWSGTAKSAIDLQPTLLRGFTTSYAYGVGGNQQVGEGFGNQVGDDALLWTGTAASAVNLNPANFSSSAAFGTNGTQQVGSGYGAAPFLGAQYQNTAIVWSGTAGSAVNLGLVLPSNGEYWNASYAYSIDMAGDVFGIAYIDSPNATAGYYAVEWSQSVPEPTAFTLLTISTGGLLLRRNRNQSNDSRSF